MTGRTDAEVIVVGAGPAGSTAAKLLAEAGREVLLLEKAAFPRNKLCGGFLSKRSLHLFEELYGPEIPADLYHFSDDRFSIYLGGEPVVERRLGARMAFTQRTEFDEYLARRAEEAGARLLERQDVRGYREEQSAAVLGTAEGREYSSRWIVAADGALSRLRRVLDPDYRPRAMALECDVPVEGESQPPRLDFGLFSKGYAWVFPKRGCVTIGLGRWPGGGARLRGLLADYFRLTGYEARPAAGWALPERPVVPASRGRLLLAGDAAGFCEPISGEGIYYALRSGERAALCLIKALQADELPRADAECALHADYRGRNALIRRQIVASLCFRPFFWSPSFQPRLVGALAKAPDLNRLEWKDIFNLAAQEILGAGWKRRTG